MKRLLFLLLTPCFAMAATPPVKRAIDFQYTDGLFGTYRLTATARQITLRAAGRVVSFDIKKCNEKLVAVYLGRVRHSLSQVRPSSRKNISNRVVMGGRTFKVVRNSAAAPVLRNLPSETYYLQRLQADLCGKSRRLPSSVGAEDIIYWEKISHLDPVQLCSGVEDVDVEFTPDLFAGDSISCLE